MGIYLGVWTLKLSLSQSPLQCWGVGCYRVLFHSVLRYLRRMKGLCFYLCLVFCLSSTLSLYHNYDSTTIQRYHDAFNYDESDRNYDMHSIRLRYDYYTTTTKNWHVHFLLASNRVEWRQARAIRRSRIVVVSQSSRNCNHGITQEVTNGFWRIVQERTVSQGTVY